MKKNGILMENLTKNLGKDSFITSDEKPKIGDWCYSIFSNKIGKVDKDFENGAISIKHGNYSEAGSITNFKKIILTTDINLINDGVKAID